MKLGVFSPILSKLSLAEALKYLENNGVSQLELGAGGYPGTSHACARELVKDKRKLSDFKKVLADSPVTISALSCHGNCVHPNKAVASEFQQDFIATLELAEQLNIHRVVTFSGCPGDGKGDKPNWVTCCWPNDFIEVLDYQWNEVLIPYWLQAVDMAKNHGVKQIALEMHPGFCVYNPSSLLRLRTATSPVIGANLDPSHLFWQGIDIVSAINALKGAIHFFHAKDTEIHREVCAEKGVLDTTSYSDMANRSWLFRTVGYGHGEIVWKQIISALKLAGYDDSISIEHEDGLMTDFEGLNKAIAFLKNIIISESASVDEMFWAK